MALAKCGPYHSTLVQTYSGPSNEVIYATSSTTSYFVWGQGCRFTQAGTLKQIKFYAQNTSTVASFVIQTWGKNQTTGLYSLANQSSNIVASLHDGLNIIDISSQNIPVTEGQFFSISIRGSGTTATPVLPICTAGSWQAKVFSTQSTTASNMDWENAPSNFVGCISIEFYMDAPDIVWFGDSIISGQPESFACTDQGAGANINYASKTTPYKFKTLTGLTYQNMGSAGDSFPNMLSRFDQDVIQKSPTYCVIEGGINNIAQSNLTPQAIADYLIDEVELAQAAGIKPILLLILPAGNNLSSTQRANYDTVNILLDEYHTNTNPDFALIDARDAVGYYSNGVWYLDAAYSADLTHLNEAGQTALAQAIYDQYMLPTASFSYANMSTTYAVSFVDRSTGTPTSWYWEFGDGYTSTEQSPIHTYANFGVYTVRLTVTNSYGLDNCSLNISSCSVTACINNQPFSYQTKNVEPSIRLNKEDTPGKYGCNLTDSKESGSDITIDILAKSIEERDNIVTAFMRSGRSLFYPGGADTGWHYSGKCGDRSSNLKFSQYNPEKHYPLSILFCTDLPFMESDVLHSRGVAVNVNNQAFNGNSYIAGNFCKNSGFDKWSNGTTDTYPDYWSLGVNSTGGSRVQNGYISTYSYQITGNGTSEELGGISQYVALEYGKTYLIGCWVKVESRTAGTAVIGLNVNNGIVGSVTWTATGDWTWKSFTYISTVTLSPAYIFIIANGTPNDGAKFSFGGVVITEASNFEHAAYGHTLETYGTVATVPDVEIMSANTWEPITMDLSANTHSTTSTSYTLRYTITIDAVSGYRIRLDDVRFVLKTQNVAATAWAKLTVQSASLYSGVETQVGEWSSAYVDGSWAATGSPLPLLAGLNESITLKISLRTTNGSYAATSLSYFVKKTLQANPPLPTNVQLYNVVDPLTRMQICNTLLPGATTRINADGTGFFKYVDLYDNWDFSAACYASSGVYVSEATKSLTIVNGGNLTYVFDLKYPIVGVPILVLYINSGMPHVKIAVDNGSGAPGTLYYSDINPIVPITDDLSWYVLNSASNLTLAGQTKIYVQIFPTGGAECIVSAIYMYADLETVDAERAIINPNGNNIMLASMQGDVNCYLSLYYRDRKWII